MAATGTATSTEKGRRIVGSERQTLAKERRDATHVREDEADPRVIAKGAVEQHERDRLGRVEDEVEEERRHFRNRPVTVRWRRRGN